jgi:hypothetical protein
MIADVKQWRNGWEDVLKLQSDAVEAFANLYNPIEPVTHPEMRHVPQETPRSFMQKCTSLQTMYFDTKADLKQETDMITTKVVQPVEEAKRCAKSMQKTLKHRENMKLDYERYLGKTEHARKRTNPSQKDVVTLERLESDLAQQRLSYEMADQQIIETFPPVTEAVMSLLPLLLTIVIEVQTTLVGQLYTNLDSYCRKQNLPSPAPSDGEIVRKWDSEFASLRYELEQNFTLLKGGKAIHQSMTTPVGSNDGIRGRIAGMSLGRKTSDNASNSQLRIQDHSSQNVARIEYEEEAPPPEPPRPVVSRAASYTSTSSLPPAVPGGKPPPSIPRNPSSSYLAPHNAPYEQGATARIPSPSGASRPSFNNDYQTDYSTPPSRYATPPEAHSGLSSSHLSPNYTTASNATEYFPAEKHARRVSTNTIGSTSSAGTTGGGQYTPALGEILAAKAKKKPPPPIPGKPKPRGPPAQYVVALYDFEGQTTEDLAFREGDRIRVVKKTDSTDDWWEGELNGRAGSFPANYVQ